MQSTVLVSFNHNNQIVVVVDVDRLNQIFQLHRILISARHPVPRKQLEEALTCSRSTFDRIKNVMINYLGAPLSYSRQYNGWHYHHESEHPYELPGLWFSAQELSALVMFDHLLRDLQPGLLDSFLDPFKKRIDQLLHVQQLGGGTLDQRIKLIGIGVRNSAHSFRIVAQATLQGKQLTFAYRARSSNATTQRTTSPQRLVYYRNNWYLDAWCHLRNDLRSFSLDRIEQAQVLAQTAETLSVEQLNQHYAAAYGIFAGNAQHWATLLFTAFRASWVAEEHWHSQQQGRFLDDGRYELKLPYADPTELIMDILRYGPDVEVLAPESLREMVRTKLQQSLKNYQT